MGEVEQRRPHGLGDVGELELGEWKLVAVRWPSRNHKEGSLNQLWNNGLPRGGGSPPPLLRSVIKLCKLGRLDSTVFLPLLCLDSAVFSTALGAVL